MVAVDYSLVGSNGDTIVFDYSNYVLNPDFIGLGIPPANVRIEPSAGDGGVFRHSKRGVRSIDMSVTVLGTDRADVQDKLRRLSRLLQDTLGPTKIVAEYPNGDTLSMEVHYVAGAESQWGSDAGLTWNKWTLSFQAPNPFWISEDIESFTISTGNTGRGLLPELTKLKVSSSQTLGTIEVDNEGDVPAFPIWEITGPVTDLTVSNGTQSFTFPEIFAGQTLTIDTEAGTVVDQNGDNRYNLLGPAPKLFRLPPGQSGVSITGTAGNNNFTASLIYSPRFEVVH